MTATSTLAVLLFWLVSPLCASGSTCADVVIVAPGSAVASRTSVTVSTTSTSRSPIATEIEPVLPAAGWFVTAPAEVSTETNVVPGGVDESTDTTAAASGPMFCTVIVTVNSPPVGTIGSFDSS